MPRLLSSLVLGLSAVAGTLAQCVIPTEPLGDTILERFSIYVQNPAIPVIHNRVMNFLANGEDEHLVLRPSGVVTGDSLWLEDGLLRYNLVRGVIDLEYEPSDDTTKLFMTARLYHPSAYFRPVYGCNPETDELQIELELVYRDIDPPLYGGQIGIREVLGFGIHEFRYSPPNNPLLNAGFMPMKMVIFRGGESPSTTLPPPTSTPTTTTPTSIPTPVELDEYDFVGCWAEPADGRALPITHRDDDMTNEDCSALCGGSEYIGTQWAIECFCGDILAGGNLVGASECDYTCGGDAGQTCGGARRLSLYRLKEAGGTSTTFSTRTRTTTTPPPGPTVTPSNPPTLGDFDYVSCWAEPPAGRALSAIDTASGTMTNEICAAFCADYAYFGTQWGQECFCGNEPATGSAAAPPGDCNFACAGDATQTCGGSRRLSLYHNEDWTGPPTPPPFGDWEWYGCVTDTVAIRTLNDSPRWKGPVMDLEFCANHCANFEFFGVEYGDECYCGNSLAPGASIVEVTECSMPCPGDASQKCGNGDRLSVYRKVD